jgi:hypothetical protein
MPSHEDIGHTGEQDSDPETETDSRPDDRNV